MRKISFLLLVCFLVWSGLALNVAAAEFKDLDRHHRFYNEMNYLKKEGIISGFPDGTFRPDKGVTRANAAVMIGRALELDDTRRATPFKDIPANHQASGYIASMAKAGYISGYPDGTFRPNEIVSRGEIAIFLSRAFALETSVVVPFKDISSAMASYPHIKRVVAYKIAVGYPDHTFLPNQPLTRGQFSAFLARTLHPDYTEHIPAVQLSHLRDPSKIYYYDTVMGRVTYRYAGDVHQDWNTWFVEIDGYYSHTILEQENLTGYYVGYPYSEYEMRLKYPTVLGQTWDGYGEQLDYYEISGTGLEVRTPAGTFYSVTAVSFGPQTEYYAPGIGLIKATYNGGTEWELLSLE